mgnify:CR=1 FL=1
MKPETTITYDGKPCRVLTTEKFLKDPLILIENQLGRVDWLQKFITQDEYQRALKGKPAPKFEKGKSFRLMYEGKAVSGYMSYGLCVVEKKKLEGSGQYKHGISIGQ